MTNSNNKKNNSGDEVLARFQGEETSKITAELKANHSLRFSVIQDEDEEDGTSICEID